MGDSCKDTCSRCDKHSGVQAELEALQDLPRLVSRLQGTVGVISVLLTIIVTAFATIYFEAERNEKELTHKIAELSNEIYTSRESHQEKRMALSSRISVLESQIKYIQPQNGTGK